MSNRSATDFSLKWVSALPLFHDLLPRELESVQGLLRRKTVPAATELVSPQGNGDTLYFLKAGALKVTAVSGGREMIMEIRGPGASTGLPSFIDGGNERVTAQTACELAVMSRFDFWNEVWPLPAVSFNMAHLLAERLRQRNLQILEIGTLDVSSRLARQLAKLAREYGQPARHESIELPFPLTQAELAQMVGTSRVHVNQTLARWNQRHMVSFRRGKIIVHQPQMLYELADKG